MKRIAFTIINYFGEKDVMAFFSNELLLQKEVELLPILVNNGSNDIQGLQDFCKKNSIHFLNPGTNLGYLNGAAFAHDYCKKNNISFDCFILSNYDILFRSEYDLKNLIDIAHERSLDVFGPQILNMPSESVANPMFETRITQSHIQRLVFVNRFYLLSALYQILHILKKRIQKNNAPQKIGAALCYAIHGSFMCFSKSFFEKKGILQYPSFLYGEELYIGEQCQIIGAQCGWTDAVVIEHHEHITTGIIKSRKHVRFLYEALSFLKKNYF
jgi:GT2 family glycosyltransferase